MTPGTPRFIARRLENKEDKVNAEDDVNIQEWSRDSTVPDEAQQA